MGKDKFENEELLKYGFPIDVWFHVDNLSSAHVYLRMPDGVSFETIDKTVLEECCQVVKDNSIEGKKKDKVVVCYTPFENLLKTGDMEIGAVSFKNKELVNHVPITRNKDILKVINKTFLETKVDFESNY
jgi:predicted ribosome quality control (RQC) complex YloA/Tae2 family protein